jgi:hypothetical protein
MPPMPIATPPLITPLLLPLPPPLACCRRAAIATPFSPLPTPTRYAIHAAIIFCRRHCHFRHAALQAAADYAAPRSALWRF